MFGVVPPFAFVATELRFDVPSDAAVAVLAESEGRSRSAVVLVSHKYFLTEFGDTISISKSKDSSMTK
jgi:hypothetical protein